MPSTRANRGRPGRRGRKTIAARGKGKKLVKLSAAALARLAKKGHKAARSEASRRKRANALRAGRSRSRARGRARKNGLALTNGLALENGRKRRSSRRKLSKHAAYMKKHKVSLKEALKATRGARGGRKSKSKAKTRKSSKRKSSKSSTPSFEKFFLNLRTSGQPVDPSDAWGLWQRAKLCSKIKRPAFTKSMKDMISMGMSAQDAFNVWEKTDPCNMSWFNLTSDQVGAFRNKKRPDFMLSPYEQAFKQFAPSFEKAGVKKREIRDVFGYASKKAAERLKYQNMLNMMGGGGGGGGGGNPPSGMQPPPLPADAFRGTGIPSAAGFSRSNPFGGLALQNGLALTNGLAQDFGMTVSPDELTSLHGWKGIAQDFVALGSGVALGAGATALFEVFGLTEKTIEVLDMAQVGTINVPYVDLPISHVIPFSAQGLAAGLVLGLGAYFAPHGHVKNILAATAGSAMAFGVGLDVKNLVTHIADQNSSSVDLDLAQLQAIDPTLAGLALENMGGLALDNVSALGDLGDGFAYTLAPLQAQTSDYGQATFGDAYYSGVDFSIDEGNALQNGRHSFVGTFGEPPYRPRSEPGNASHLAGQRGHRWGWLIRLVGWEKAAAICRMKPAQRVALIHKLRQAAMGAYQKSMLAERAVAAESAPAQAEFTAQAPAAGTVAGSPQGAGNGFGSAEYLSDGALFAQN